MDSSRVAIISNGASEKTPLVSSNRTNSATVARWPTQLRSISENESVSERFISVSQNTDFTNWAYQFGKVESVNEICSGIRPIWELQTFINMRGTNLDQ